MCLTYHMSEEWMTKSESDIGVERCKGLAQIGRMGAKRSKGTEAERWQADLNRA